VLFEKQVKARISGPASSKSASGLGEGRALLDSLPGPQEPQSQMSLFGGRATTKVATLRFLFEVCLRSPALGGVENLWVAGRSLCCGRIGVESHQL
jgi:hypothetical protein